MNTHLDQFNSPIASPFLPDTTPPHTTRQTQVYPDLLATAAHAPAATAAPSGTGPSSSSSSKGLGVDLVTYFDEMHESVFRAATALPLAVRVRGDWVGGIGLWVDNLEGWGGRR